MNNSIEEQDKTINYIKTFLDDDYISLKDNLEKLLKDYERKSKRLDTIIKRGDQQQLQLIKLNEELDEYKNHLEEKVEEEIKKRQEKEKMLLQQSKLAAMGEMMDAIAHQWKQPINIIHMQVDLLGYDYQDNLVDLEYIKKFRAEVFGHIKHMSDTLAEFRTFFRPNKENEEFDIKDMINKVLFLVKDEFIQHKIEIVINDEESFKLIGVENEFKHLILNIINNSKDAFNDNDIENRKIQINILKDNKSIEIIDNAGGIPQDIIPDIFKANVTTKEEGEGTGIGLYMSSQIATKHNGTLTVQNVDGGAKFVFSQNDIDIDS